MRVIQIRCRDARPTFWSAWLRKLHIFELLNKSFRPMEEIQALRTYWHDELLFVLEQSLELYGLYVRKIAVCDQRIEQHLKKMTSKQKTAPTSDPTAFPSAKQEPRFSLEDHLRSITGVNLTRIAGQQVADRADHNFRGWCRHEPLED